MDPIPYRLPHLEFEREPDRAPRRRQGAAWGGQRPSQTSRADHGAALSGQLSTVSEQTITTRRALGIAPGRLRVFELSSILLEAREHLEQRFRVRVVDERREDGNGGGGVKLTVQFEDNDAIEVFEHELMAYREGAATTGALPQRLRNQLFDAVVSVSLPGRDDRIGARLHHWGWPTEVQSYFDVDLWHPGHPEGAREVLDNLRMISARSGGSVTDEVATKTLLLAKVRGTVDFANALLDLDLVARVDLPPRLSSASAQVVLGARAPDFLPLPADDAPMVCVIDSGVVAGHPLLRGWVVEERDFGSGEETAVDLQGHGTAVAGVVVHGDIAASLEQARWNPTVRICSAKVLRRHPDGWDVAHFPEERRIERTFDEAIRYFHRERGCRVFNISVEVEADLYEGGRQFPWAEQLDELARELDIVIVVLAGNRSNAPIPEGPATRDELFRSVRDGLLAPEQRVCNPATTALGLTVGSIARTDAVGDHDPDGIAFRIHDAVPASLAGSPSPFTRTGPGYSIDQTKAMIKPDVVHFGGNWAIQRVAGGSRDG